MAELRPCGTVAAYERHRRAGEVPCQECRRARSDYVRARSGYGPRRPPQCGTHAGYVAHRAAGQQACQECIAANREYGRLWRARRARRAVLDALLAEAWEEACGDVAPLAAARVE